MPAAARTSGIASCPAPQITSRSGGSSTSTNARTPPANVRISERPAASCSCALAVASASTSASPSDPSVGPSGRTSKRAPGATRSGTSDSNAVTTQIGRSSSRAARSACVTAAARSAGSMKTSIAPLQPRPSPHTSSSSAVRSQPASRAVPSSMTTRAMSATSPSRHPPLMLPTGAPSSGTSSRAPGRRYVEPRTATIVASAMRWPCALRPSIASRTSAISLTTRW